MSPEIIDLIRTSTVEARGLGGLDFLVIMAVSGVVIVVTTNPGFCFAAFYGAAIGSGVTFIVYNCIWGSRAPLWVGILGGCVGVAVVWVVAGYIAEQAWKNRPKAGLGIDAAFRSLREKEKQK